MVNMINTVNMVNMVNKVNLVNTREKVNTALATRSMKTCPPDSKIFESTPYLTKNDDSVKEAPAYCRSFLDSLYN